jgi:hypothetical protein
MTTNTCLNTGANSQMMMLITNAATNIHTDSGKDDYTDTNILKPMH